MAEGANLFRTEQQRCVALSAHERDCVLAIDGRFASLAAATYFDNYDLPCPIRVSVRTRAGRIETVVLRRGDSSDVHREVSMFRALREAGLAVPEVLGGPFDVDNGEVAAVYSLLPGENLQALASRSSADLDCAKELLLDAVTVLGEATDVIRARAVSSVLPERTLVAQLDAVTRDDNPWRGHPVVEAAMASVGDRIAAVAVPLVLSNGDYQPGNFLADAGRISGYVDFESACFQDPLIGFSKYTIYDMIPLSRTDLIERFLDRNGFSARDFDCRLALGCLEVLVCEIPVVGGDDEMQRYRQRVLGLLSVE